MELIKPRTELGVSAEADILSGYSEELASNPIGGVNGLPNRDRNPIGEAYIPEWQVFPDIPVIDIEEAVPFLERRLSRREVSETLNAESKESTGRDVLTGLDLGNEGGTLVFVDAGIADAETLVAGVVPGAEVVMLTPDQDGVSQITQVLAKRQELSSVHIISHGMSAGLQLGTGQLNLDTLNTYASQLQTWAGALTPDADILFYACSLVATASGKQFIEQVSQLTGADVAASSDRTGSAALGGDWDLEVSQGTIESDLALHKWAQSAYQAVLDAVDNNLTVRSASFLGGSGDDSGNAVEIAPDRTIVIGGNFDLTPTQSLAPGQGAVIRVDSTGQTVLSVTQVGTDVDDLDLNRNNGTITVVGDFGVKTLNSDASQVLWSANPGSAQRVAVAGQGQVAVLADKQVTVYNPQGTPIGNFTVSGTQIADVAIDSNTSSVFVTGYRQVGANLQLPLLRSYSYTGQINWENYDFSANEATTENLGADTRGLRVAIGQDNQLYLAGSLDGGNSVFQRDPKNITTTAGNVNIDNYTNTSNSGGGKFAYFARLNPATGTLDKGQIFLTRRSSDNAGNSFAVNAITADAKGRVYIGGQAGAFLPDRSQLQINGTPVGDYSGFEGAVIAVSEDFQARELVGLWSGGNPSGSEVNGVAVFGDIRAMVSTNTGTNMITVNPLQGTSGGNRDAFFSVWQSPATPVGNPPTAIGLDNRTVAENTSPGTVVGMLSTNDPDVGDSHTYRLIDDAGGRFAIAQNKLQVADGSQLDFETNKSHQITVRSTDADGFSFEEDFEIAIADVDEGDDNPTPTPTLPVGLVDLAQIGSTQGVFQVGGTPKEAVRLQFDWTFREAKFKNEVGVLRVDDAMGTVNGVRPGDPGYAQQALTRAERQVLFARSENVGKGVDLTLEAGDYWVFYLIQDSTTADWLAQNPENRLDGETIAFFSVTAANPDQFNHVQRTDLGDGMVQLAWEDLTGGGDQDFNDIIFNVSNADWTVPGDLEEIRPLILNWMAQDSLINHELGLFLFDHPNGRIGNLFPGDPGYAAAALSQPNRQVIVAPGETGNGQRTLNVESDRALGWYLIPNGTTEQFLQENPDNLLGNSPLAFFSLIAANPNGSDTFWRLSPNEFAWTDLTNDNDLDFNVRIRLQFG
ncbi:MAG: DUF4347 domain-containing protein [Coleofasciculus sp. G1-WW12-02]|uniref:DUF4347 domain-containing protein n=1 Tax=Coleofasciculus sp. G1-WW12-02 TaxID=3068483 RepID=UPI0032F73D8E